MLVPGTQVLGVAPGLKEGARALYPRLTFTRMRVGILAEAADSSLDQCLSVHILEKLPSRLYLTVLDHPLHSDTIVPQPDSAIVIGIILMIIVPVLVLRVELAVPLCERSHSPRIYELFPASAGHSLLEVLIIYKVEAVKLVRAELLVRSAVWVEVVIYKCLVLTAVVAFEVACQEGGEAAPVLCRACVVKEIRNLTSGHQLGVPQGLDVVGSVAAWRTRDAVSLDIHPGVGVCVSQVAVFVSIVLD